jgi:hypothetical protein
LSTTHEIIHGDCGKNLSVFHNFITYDAYKWKHLRKNNKRVEKDATKFGVKVTVKFVFDFELFFYRLDSWYHPKLFCVIFYNFLHLFYVFDVSITIIEKFSLPCAKLEHTAKKNFTVCPHCNARQTPSSRPTQHRGPHARATVHATPRPSPLKHPLPCCKLFI